MPDVGDRYLAKLFGTAQVGAGPGRLNVAGFNLHRHLADWSIGDRKAARFLGTADGTPIYAAQSCTRPCGPYPGDRILGRFLGTYEGTGIYGAALTDCDACRCDVPAWLDLTVSGVGNASCGTDCAPFNGTFRATRNTYPGPFWDIHAYSVHVDSADVICSRFAMNVIVNIYCDAFPLLSPCRGWWAEAFVICSNDLWHDSLLWFPRPVAEAYYCENHSWLIPLGPRDEWNSYPNDPGAAPLCDFENATLEITDFGF